ncbi:MAG TPA: macrolide ABC transporter ATP-binding protein [Clostridiales bacterium]|nr:macrolide ABC transporter ATP-binding protein [Clostridiales bacterium]
MDNILSTQDLSRDFISGRDTVHALKNINVRFRPQKLTILRGRSGSGKTTLINLLGALDIPTSGKVFLEGDELSGAPQNQRDAIRCKKMGFVFQSVALISLMSAYENVEFGLRIADYDPKNRKDRAEEVLGLVGLTKRMHHRPGELSGGEQQRVAIARAMAHRPQIVFADEPTAELDSHTGLQVVWLFKKLIEKEGLTIIMTTHDPSMMEVADHVYTLEDGEIIDER